MEITSFVFYIFVGISLLLYWKLPAKHQWKLLLVDSIVFYFLNATYYTFIYVLVSVISIYYATKYFEKEADEVKKKRVLVFVLLTNVLILAALKYANLFIDTFNSLSKNLLFVNGISNVRWLAPLAISFYTLQMVAYLLDCYWGMAKPFSNPLKLLLYCIYFPLMISGPICRYEQIGESLFEEHRFSYDDTKKGLIRISYGLVKKMAISNRLAIIVNQMWVYEDTSSGIFVWIAMALFIFQLYTDFSGCMDIITGVSNCFGIKLPENFKAPLLSKNMQEFWQRWHISLGTWLRDYIMNPILKSRGFIKLGKYTKAKFGKNVGKKVPTYLAMLVLWLCMGLWHGNSWKYVLGEGLWFWFVIVLSQILDPLFDKLINKLRINVNNLIYKAFQIVRTFILYMLGMIFFRADSLNQAIERIKSSFSVPSISAIGKAIRHAVRFDDVGSYYGLVAIFVGMMLVLIVDILKYKNKDPMEILTGSKWYIRWPIYYLITLILITSIEIANQAILYAQF